MGTMAGYRTRECGGGAACLGYMGIGVLAPADPARTRLFPLDLLADHREQVFQHARVSGVLNILPGAVWRAAAWAQSKLNIPQTAQRL